MECPEAAVLLFAYLSNHVPTVLLNFSFTGDDLIWIPSFVFVWLFQDFIVMRETINYTRNEIISKYEHSINP